MSSLNLKNLQTKDGRNDMKLINSMVEHEKYELFQHPSTQTFVALKWELLKKYLHFNLIPAVLFAIVLTLAVILELNYHQKLDYLGMQYFKSF